MKEYVFYKRTGDSVNHGPLYFVVPTEQWENHIKSYGEDEHLRTELARGTEDEMNRLHKLIGEEE